MSIAQFCVGSRALFLSLLECVKLLAQKTVVYSGFYVTVMSVAHTESLCQTCYMRDCHARPYFH